MNLAFVSGNEWIIVALVAVLLFGGSQLPKLARSLGQARKEFEKGTTEDSEDVDDKAADRDATS